MKLHEESAIREVFKPSWYVHQLKGWTKSSYYLLFFGIGIIVGTTISSPMNIWSILTMFAGVLGYTTTLAITNTRPLNGVFGLISAVIYCIVATHAKNYADVVLQISYIIALDLPVLLVAGWAKNVGKKVRKLGEGPMNWITTILVLAVVYAALYFVDVKLGSPRPFIDAFAGAIGITGAILATLRYSDQYWFWITQGILSVTLWGITAAQGDANLTLFFTYMLYILNDIVALFDKGIAWFHKENYLKQEAEKNAHAK